MTRCGSALYARAITKTCLSQKKWHILLQSECIHKAICLEPLERLLDTDTRLFLESRIVLRTTWWRCAVLDQHLLNKKKFFSPPHNVFVAIGFSQLFGSPFKAACPVHHRKRFGVVARVYMTLREQHCGIARTFRFVCIYCTVFVCGFSFSEFLRCVLCV